MLVVVYIYLLALRYLDKLIEDLHVLSVDFRQLLPLAVLKSPFLVAVNRMLQIHLAPVHQGQGRLVRFDHDLLADRLFSLAVLDFVMDVV